MTYRTALTILFPLFLLTAGCDYVRTELAFRRANQAEQERDYEALLRISLPEARRPGPDQPAFLTFAGRAYRGLGRLGAAKAAGLRGLELAPVPGVEANLYELLSDVYAQTDSTAQALWYAKRSIQANPDDIILWNNCGHIHMQLGEYEQAVALYTAATERFPPHPFVLNNRAECHIRLGQLDAADADLRASHRLDPSNPYLYKNKALYHQQRNETALACQHAARAARLFDDKLGYTYDKASLAELLAACDLKGIPD